MNILIWIVFLTQLVLSFIFKDFITNYDSAALLLVMINSIVVTIILLKKNVTLGIILYIAFILRFLVMIIDVYGSQLLIIPHSGNDTENFLNFGLRVAQDLTLLKEEIYGGMYTKFLGIILFIGPESRIIPQYINILLSISSLLLLINALKKLSIPKSSITTLICVFTFFPHSIIFSSILLRESLISFLIMVALYFLVKWYKNGRIYYSIFSLLLSFIAASIHSGVIGLLVGQLFLFLFYNHSIKKLNFTIISILKFLIILLFSIVILGVGVDNLSFFDKFTQYVDDIDDVYSVANGSNIGNSSYLESLSIDSFSTLILYLPVKFIYFISSPLPWDWRGFNDIFSFSLDSIFYIISFIFMIKNYKKNIKHKPLYIALLISLISILLIFSTGISNAGTAMRHRYKVFFLILIILGLITNKNRKNNYNN